MNARLLLREGAMIRERGVLSLSALKGASTARVLNLHHIGSDNAHNPEHWQKPLFLCPAINNAFLFKHGLRSDEKYLFDSRRAVVTKLVVPFDRQDLLVGGQAIFVGQRGYAETLRAAGNYSSEMFERDLARSDAITLERWRSRSFGTKLLERFIGLFQSEL